MFSTRILFGCALATVLTTSTTSPARILGRDHHLHYLHQALHELGAAHGEIKANHASRAHHHISAAIHHLDEAIGHHKKHHLSQQRTGLSGAITTAAHHHHHGILQRALAECHKAERQLKTGQVGKAAHDVTEAEKHVQAAIRSHHHLIG
jgi:hypothetical protein